ncbi:hypothetical protein U8C35_06535 [Sinorhizobium medicae]|uniref:hypothetical protein n=1 Tax=Sinorhizobium medicae TaxID=110321 RepID=UPI002AF6B4FB|nr:hypothetical protein [Sinorhizobium medicae]WQO60090.1 hypothetical protein U8C35_06535 [Sinorhizobium medicae]
MKKFAKGTFATLALIFIVGGAAFTAKVAGYPAAANYLETQANELADDYHARKAVSATTVQ